MGIPDDYACYSQEEQTQIANGIIKLRKCEAELGEYKIVTDKFMANSSTATLWWQESSVIVAGVVVSFNVGLLVGFYAFKK